jgi:hypothetical protein
MPSNRLRDSLDTLTKQTVFHILNEVFLFQFLMEFFCFYMDVARMYPGMLISMNVPFPHIFRIEFEPLDVPAALHNRSFFDESSYWRSGLNVLFHISPVIRKDV